MSYSRTLTLPAKPRRKATLALFCPDTNLPIGVEVPFRTAIRGGKAGLVHWAKALARRNFQVTIFAGKPVEGQQGSLTVKALEACEGHFDVVVFHTGQLLHFEQPQIERIHGDVHVLWLRGPVRVAPPRKPLDAVVAQSRFIQQLAERQWGFAPSQLQLIRGEAVTRKFSDHWIRVAARDPFLGAYLSPPEKGFDSVLSTLDRLYGKGFRFRLAVYGNQAFWGDISALAEIPWLEFKGDVPQTQMQDTLLHCGFLPYFVSWADGCSLATAEAMSAGVVVFASAHGSNAEFVEHGKTGFLVPTEGGKPDQDAAEALLERYFLKPEDFLPMRLSAARVVPTWSEVAAQWETFLLRLLQEKKRSRFEKNRGQTDDSVSEQTQPNSAGAEDGGTSRKLSVLLAGDFGVGNTGDDAILLSSYQLFRARKRTAEVTVVAPKVESLSYLKVPALSLWSWDQVDEAVAASDLVVVAGGGLFHDWWALERDKLLSAQAEGPTAYLSLVARAKRAGKPCFVLGVGIGPLRKKDSVEFVAEVLGKADLITVRDQRSYRILEAAGVTKRTAVAVSADPAFDLPHQRQPSRELWRSLGIEAPPRPRICLVLRGWDVTHPQSSFLPRVATAVARVLAESHGSCLFLPLQVGQGHAWTDDVAVGVLMRKYLSRSHELIILPHLSPLAVDAVIAECDAVLTMRYHGAVFAIRNLVPVLALAYDPKVENLFSDALLSSWCWPLNGWDARDLAQALGNLLTQPFLQRDRQRAYRHAAKQRLALHAQVLDRFLFACQRGMSSSAALSFLCFPGAGIAKTERNL